MSYPLREFSDVALPFRISADIQDHKGLLLLSFRLEGDLDSILFPSPVAKPQTEDGLWQSTCCEVFLRWAGQSAYEEWNFSPSGNWAHYGFQSYRERTESWQPKTLSVPVHTKLTRQLFELEVGVERPMSRGDVSGLVEYSLTAVVQEKNEERHYWALTHAGQKPDFHDARSFIGKLNLRSF